MHKPEYIYGINTLTSLLKINAGSRRIYNIFILENKVNSERIREIITLAESKSISVRIVNEKFFYEILKYENFSDFKRQAGNLDSKDEFYSSQGIAAEVSGYNYSDFDRDIKEKKDNKSVLVILDGITDVGNFGSILRNCSAFGVGGVIITRDRSVSVNRRVSKISSGALEEVKIYKVVNLARTISILKDKGYWIYGSTLGLTGNIVSVNKVSYAFPLALVLGSEKSGISRITEKNCDFLIKIDIENSIQSLNVSTASGIILYTIYIQR